MKRTLTYVIVLLTVLSAPYSLFAQKQDFEKKTLYELEGRAKFYELTPNYTIQDDTVFYTKSGFYIHPEWDLALINGKEYIIVTYPDFERGKQSIDENQNIRVVGTEPVHFPLINKGGKDQRPLNGKLLAIPKEEFDALPKVPLYSISFKNFRNFQVSAGQLTVPFKLRPKEENKKFQMTTDVTLGAYGGIKKRLSRRSATYVTLPIVLGLSFININENTTTTVGQPDANASVVPGWTWSTGLVLQFDNLNAGIVVGRDYASGYADDWLYHNKTWYSFAIGYSFLK